MQKSSFPSFSLSLSLIAVIGWRVGGGGGGGGGGGVKGLIGEEDRSRWIYS